MSDSDSQTDQASDLEDQIARYCGLLSCGKVLVQSLGRGRRKEFCSETCRRAADRDYKRAMARTELFEEQLRKAKHHAAAYGRKAEPGVLTPEVMTRLQGNVREAFARASTVVELGTSPERAAEELERLVTALRPLLETQHDWIATRSA